MIVLVDGMHVGTELAYRHEQICRSSAASRWAQKKPGRGQVDRARNLPPNCWRRGCSLQSMRGQTAVKRMQEAH